MCSTERENFSVKGKGKSVDCQAAHVVHLLQKRRNWEGAEERSYCSKERREELSVDFWWDLLPSIRDVEIPDWSRRILVSLPSVPSPVSMDVGSKAQHIKRNKIFRNLIESNTHLLKFSLRQIMNLSFKMDGRYFSNTKVAFSFQKAKGSMGRY